MALPVLVSPEYQIKLHSIDETVTYRPFLVKEEKILLMALETNEPSAIANATKQIVNNCVISPKIKVDTLPMFDVEYLFLNIRARSISDVITLKMSCQEVDCEGVAEVDVNLDEIKLQNTDQIDNKLWLTEEVGVVMSFPNFKNIGFMTDLGGTDATYKLIVQSIESIFDKENVYDRGSHSEKEFEDFVASLNTNQFQKMVDFFQKMPALKHDVTFTCPVCSVKANQTVQGLQNFFL